MTGVFLRILSMSITGGAVILIILAARPFFRRAPRRMGGVFLFRNSRNGVQERHGRQLQFWILPERRQVLQGSAFSRKFRNFRRRSIGRRFTVRSVFQI